VINRFALGGVIIMVSPSNLEYVLRDLNATLSSL
jgi:hypothetical protein